MKRTGMAALAACLLVGCAAPNESAPPPLASPKPGPEIMAAPPASTAISPPPPVDGEAGAPGEALSAEEALSPAIQESAAPPSPRPVNAPRSRSLSHTGSRLAARDKNYARAAAGAAGGPTVQSQPPAYYALQSLPPLPGALPAPSTKTVCPRPAEPSLASYQAMIDGALASVDHTESSYFRYQDGFAVVSKLERIRGDGEPAADDRWPDVSLRQRRSIVDFIARLIAPRPGFYRFSVITVGGSEPEINVAERQTPEGGAELLAAGAAQRPDLTGAAVDPSLKCTILIYEFEQAPGGEGATQRFPSRIPALSHARNLGFPI